MKAFSAILLLTLCFSFSVAALTLKEAKRLGIVGEQQDGYLGIVKSHVDAPKLILSVNNKRLQHYKKLAANNKLAVATVAKLAGEKAIAKTVKGNYVQSAQGKWKKK